MKSDEKSIQAISAQAHNAEADNRVLRNKLRKAESDVERLRAQVAGLTQKLSEKMDEVSDSVKQMVSFMMGKGDVNLSNSIRESVVGPIREEIRKEFQSSIDELKAIIANKDVKITVLEAQLNNVRDNDGMAPATKIKTLGQQNKNLRTEVYGQGTEGKHHGRNHMTPADEADLNGEDVPESTFDVSDKEFDEIIDGIKTVINAKGAVKSSGRKKGVKVPQRMQPLLENAVEKVLEPDFIPEGAERCGEEVTIRYVYHKAYIQAVKFVRPKYKLGDNYYQASAPKHGLGKCRADASLMSLIIYRHFVQHVTMGDIERELSDLGLDLAHSTLVHWIEKAAAVLEPLDGPLHDEIINSGNYHGDESTLQVKDKAMDAAKEDKDRHYFIRWIFNYVSPSLNLTQYYFHKRGSRSREAVVEYNKGVNKRTFLHSDGAPIYKIYDTGELILRVACGVHVRRAFYKLKDGSDEAMEIVIHFNDIFKLERLWNQESMDAEERRRRRGLYIAPILKTIKDKLDVLSKVLDKQAEPDLLKAVNYALKEFPCLLRCLENGNLAFSNNICEQQMRRIAIYRNNSFFVGSIESAKLFARLSSHVQSSVLCKKNTMRYIQDILNKVGNTGKDRYATLLVNRWEDPIVIPLVY